jgi:hypothetical protein
LLLLAVSAATGCARASQGGPATALRGRGAVVEVRNDTFDDLVIYMIRGGTPIPIGVAPGMSRRSIGVGEGQLSNGGGVALAAGKRGGPIEQISAPFDLPPGRYATWTVRSGTVSQQPVVR